MTRIWPLWVWLIVVTLPGGQLRADVAPSGVSVSGHAMSNQALTFEPIVFENGTEPNLGDLSYDISLGRYFSFSGLAEFESRKTDNYAFFQTGLGLGLSFWIFSSGPFQGLYLKRELRVQNTWVNSAAATGGAGTEGGFSLDQGFETGYGWAFRNYLLELRLRFRYLSELDAIALAIGYRW